MIKSGSITDAYDTIDPAFLNTPVLSIDALNAAVGCVLSCKVETMSPIRSFKGRGADNLVARTELPPGARLVCASAGNFGWGIAYSARTRGVPATIYGARTANPLKMAAIRACGAEVVLEGADFDEAKHVARARATAEGWVFVNDGAHEANSAGAGTIAKELTDADVPFDAILVPLGNGALVNGIGSWLRKHRPSVEMIAVAASGAPAMERSWREDRIVEMDIVDTIADGLGIRVPVPEAVAMMRETVDDVALVTDAAMLDAMRLVHGTAGLVLEPSGAAGVAAILAEPDRFAGRCIATVLCGSNIDPGLLSTLVSTDASKETR